MFFRKEEVDLIITVVNFLARIIGLCGVGIIFWGVSLNFLQFIGAERTFIRTGRVPTERERLRQNLGFYILLGLEFLIAADMIRTISRPSLQEVAVLGGIVLIRTVISFNLNREVGTGKGKKGS